MTLDKHWYIAIIPNKSERIAADFLSKHYEVLLPAQKVVSIWKDGRRKIRNRILIPGKLLIRCTESERLEVCNCCYVSRFMVDIASAPNEFGRRKVAIVPDEQIERLKFILGQKDAKVEMDNMNLLVGEKVRVVRGAMMGLEGIVSRLNSSDTINKIYININHLGCATLEVLNTDLERV